MSGKESVEYKTMDSLSDLIYEGCKSAPIALCRTFHERELISYDLLSTCSEKYEDNERLAKNLVEALKKRVEFDQKAFDGILETFEQTKGVSYIAKKMKEVKEQEFEKQKKYHSLSNTSKRRTSSKVTATPQPSSTGKALPMSSEPTHSKSTGRAPSKSAGASLRTGGSSIKDTAIALESDEDATTEQPSSKPLQQATTSSGATMLHGLKPVKMDTTTISDEDESSNLEMGQPLAKCHEPCLNKLSNPFEFLNLKEARCCKNCQSLSNQMAKLREDCTKEKEAGCEKISELNKEHERNLKEIKRAHAVETRQVKDECDEKIQQLREEMKELKEEKKQLKKENANQLKELKKEMKDEMKEMKSDYAEAIKQLKRERVQNSDEPRRKGLSSTSIHTIKIEKREEMIDHHEATANNSNKDIIEERQLIEGAKTTS